MRPAPSAGGEGLQLLSDAEDDLLAFLGFPLEHRCLLIEQRDEWLVQKRDLSQESLAALYTNERCALADADQPALQRSAGPRRQEARPMITT